MKADLEPEGDIHAVTPAGEVATPKARDANANPLEFPDLVEAIQHNARTAFVIIVGIQAVAEAAVKIGAAEKAARAQLMSP